MSTNYRLRVLRVEDLNWEHVPHSEASNIFVKVKLGDYKKETRPVVISSPTWNVSLPFSSPDDSAMLEIKVKVKQHGSMRWTKDPCIGFTSITVIDLLKKCADGEASLSLTPNSKSSTASAGQIVLSLEVIDTMTSADMNIAAASEDIRRRKIMRSERASDVTQSKSDQVSELNSQRDLYEAVGKLLSRLDAFQQVINSLSEIHPFLTIAWKLVSGLYSAVEKVFKTDKKVVDLVRSMINAFDFIRDVETLPDKSDRMQQAIVELLKQTIECCLFVSRYTSRNFLGRMLDISSSQKIDEFERSLASFKQEIESGVALHTAFVSMRVPQGIDELLLQQRLSPGQYDAFDRPLCLPETRVEIKREIVEWAFSDSKQNIFWLHGVAGSGKSTVSSTIAKHFREMSRLGAFLFFQRGKSEPSSVIKTIAYKLALFDSSIASSILCEVENDKDIGSASSEAQFRKLLLQPLLDAASAMTGPVIVVLDALDECGMADSRRGLMKLFREEFSKLPKTFRFLITSRRETDINHALSTQPESVRTMQLDYSSAASQQDVLSYLRAEMRKAVSKMIEIPDDYPWEENISQLSRAARGLFIWASTAIKMVENGIDPFGDIDRLVSDAKSLSLDDLYATVLRGSGIPWHHEQTRIRVKQVLMLLLQRKVPISCRTMDGILGFRSRDSCVLILSRLQSLISYTIEGPVNLFHASFSDYLTSPEHSSEPWSIVVDDANQLIVEQCFSVMEVMLHFNMCNLETSFVRNDDVPDLTNRVEVCIPSHLEYACIHWVHHLCDVSYSPYLLDKLSDFAYKRLVFWFEVLSLVEMFGRVASRSLLQAVMWIESTGIDVISFLQDASELATIFAMPIMESTPHIYVTMIPFSMDESMVSAHYSTQMSSMVEFHPIGSKRPLKYMRVLEGHKGGVRSVAVSSNGRLIASASCDRTIKVWDLHSGEEIMTLADNSQSVSFFPDGRRLASVSYVRDGGLRIWDVQTAVSPDGTRIASGHSDGTIILWDMSGGTELKRFAGDKNGVFSIAFSPDGSLLASGSSVDSTRIWEIDSGEPTFRTLTIIGARTLARVRDRYVLSINRCYLVSFTPDGKYIVSSCLKQFRIHEVESGSAAFVFDGFRALSCFSCGTRAVVDCRAGNGFSVMDLTNGMEVSGPFEGTGRINSVAITPDGQHIISSSSDETVRIWDTAAAKGGSKTFMGHKNICNVTISDDGSLVASGSYDSTIIWDAQTGGVISGFLDTGYVRCMAFSSDNSRLVSASSCLVLGSNRVSVWAVATGQLAFSSMEGHNKISCVAISPDGTVIASGHDGGTLKVWEMATGQLIIEPFDVFPDDEVTSLEFSPNGNRLASGSKNGKITVWNTAAWGLVSEFPTRHTGRVHSIRFSPDSTQIAFESLLDNTVTVLNVEEGHIVADPFELPECPSSSLMFTLNGLYHAAVENDYDGYISVRKLLDADGARSTCDRLVLRCFERIGKYPSVASSRDGSRIVSCLDEETIRVWDVSDLLPSKRCDDRSNALSKWILTDDGWIVAQTDNEKRDLVVWVPHDLRPTLCQARNTAVFNCRFSTKLDFLGAALGDRWSECFVPSHRRALA
ncbi:hypothetical protein ACEPAI_1571 [Sanghuangporus weigelae]